MRTPATTPWRYSSVIIPSPPLPDRNPPRRGGPDEPETLGRPVPSVLVRVGDARHCYAPLAFRTDPAACSPLTPGRLAGRRVLPLCPVIVGWGGVGCCVWRDLGTGVPCPSVARALRSLPPPPVEPGLWLRPLGDWTSSDVYRWAAFSLSAVLSPRCGAQYDNPPHVLEALSAPFYCGRGMDHGSRGERVGGEGDRRSESAVGGGGGCGAGATMIGLVNGPCERTPPALSFPPC